MSNLRVINVSPREEQPQYFASVHAFDYDVLDDSPMSTPDRATHVPLSIREGMSSRIASPTPASILQTPYEREEEQITAEPSRPLTDDADGEDEFELGDSYNLKAPLPPGQLSNSLEALTERFFSADHLDVILRDQSLATRFSGFLTTYLPQYVGTLKQYGEAKKVLTALEYANATAGQLSLQYGQSMPSTARLDESFEARKNELVRGLVNDALPAFLTHQLVSLVTDTLVKEITGNSAPIMRELVPSLAEVYCISDPSLPDNPIVYASEGESPIQME